MIKRPSASDTQDDLLRMQNEFAAERQRNPKLKPAAKVLKPAKKSVFAQRRSAQAMEIEPGERASTSTAAAESVAKSINEKNTVFGGISERPTVLPNIEILTQKPEPIELEATGATAAAFMNRPPILRMADEVGDVIGRFQQPEGASRIPTIVIGDIVERQYCDQSVYIVPEMYRSVPFPATSKAADLGSSSCGRSVFGRSVGMDKPRSTAGRSRERKRSQSPGDSMPEVKRNLHGSYGNCSAIINDPKLSRELHKENITLLGKMCDAEILAERNRLLETVDPSYVAMLTKKRQETAPASPSVASDTAAATTPGSDTTGVSNASIASDNAVVAPEPAVVNDSTAQLLARSHAERWVNFDVVEQDKLAWMNDLSEKTAKLDPNVQLEARFDWKGVLLADTIQIGDKESAAPAKAECDDRDLYLHGDDPNRAGYTLQEFFRFARSTVQQQRISGFGAIAGMIKIYNNGFYDGVIDLPMSKIFFLLRFGLDENNVAVLENVALAMAYLFYNETDEMLLDANFENPAGIWQPLLGASRVVDGKSASLDSMMRRVRDLNMADPPKSATTVKPISAPVSDDHFDADELTDLELAETDMAGCLWRTDIDQRIYYILQVLHPANGVPESCLKILIRLARTSSAVAEAIATKTELITCIMKNFLPSLDGIDIALEAPPFYNYPQPLAMKLLRVLISQSVAVARLVMQYPVLELLQSYLINSYNIRGKLLKVQIESMRIIRCLLKMDVNGREMHRLFLPVMCYLLLRHFHNDIYDAKKSPVIRQHAACIMAFIANGPTNVGLNEMLFMTVFDCCGQWFFHAARQGIKDFSQATLLASALDAFLWSANNGGDFRRYKGFCDNQMRDFIASAAFVEFISKMATASAFTRKAVDRRSENAPLPNAGSVVVTRRMPQLIVGDMYPAHLFNVIFRLMMLQIERSSKSLFEDLIHVAVAEPLKRYIKVFAANPNPILATNFFARTEVSMLFKLLTYDGFNILWPEGSQMALTFLLTNCLTADNAPDIEKLMDMLVFNPSFYKVEQKKLDLWKQSCMEIVQSHFIVLPPQEMTLTIACDKSTVLPPDWPFIHMKWLLKDHINMINPQPANSLSERDIIEFTFTIVGHLQSSCSKVALCSPTEELMYCMIAFMGSETQFLDPEINSLLRRHLYGFFKRHADHKFVFDELYEGKCKFENLFVLFVNQFQAASYGSDLFSALLLLPLAQKYDNKYRRRIWSDISCALRFVDCHESLLIGGIQAYLEPLETDTTLLLDYTRALSMKAVRKGSIPYIIAKHHVDTHNDNVNKASSTN